MTPRIKIAAALLVLVFVGAVGGWLWWQDRSTRLPDHVTSGNGRIEADEVHVGAKYPGRVAEVLVDEGEMVAAGQLLARMDVAEERASLARALADVAQAEEEVSKARAEILQRQSELTFARQELERALYLVERGHFSEERVEERQSTASIAKAALAAAQAHLKSALRRVDSANAEAERIQTIIEDSNLKAPRQGRIEYRLAEPGEVLEAGGKVVTLLDLTDVYMTIFLPTAEVGRVFVGSDARIILDAVPQYVIPARVSFIASEAQFTPRQVETKNEREKLMFRVKVKIDPELLLAYIERVKTGLPGEAFVMLGPDGLWPDSLEVRLPPLPEQ